MNTADISRAPMAVLLIISEATSVGGLETAMAKSFKRRWVADQNLGIAKHRY